MHHVSVAAVAAVFVMALGQAASAASPSQGDDWTGWFIGLNVGGNWGRNPVDTTASNSQYCASCGHSMATAAASILGATGQIPSNTDGFIGGGQLGYDHQFADRWVAGFEADFQGLAGTGGFNSSESAFSVSGFSGHSVGTSTSVKKRIDYLGTVRGRLGYQVMPDLVVYGTGGFAYGHVKARTSITQYLIGTFGGLATSWTAESGATKVLGGWTAGGGIEWKFAPKWTAQFEYLYYDLGKVTSSSQLVDQITIPKPPVPNYFVNNVRSTTRFNGAIIRLALNYHF